MFNLQLWAKHVLRLGSPFFFAISQSMLLSFTLFNTSPPSGGLRFMQTLQIHFNSSWFYAWLYWKMLRDRISPEIRVWNIKCQQYFSRSLNGSQSWQLCVLCVCLSLKSAREKKRMRGKTKQTNHLNWVKAKRMRNKTKRKFRYRSDMFRERRRRDISPAATCSDLERTG